jgi:hypothetical protein
MLNIVFKNNTMIKIELSNTFLLLIFFFNFKTFLKIIDDVPENPSAFLVYCELKKIEKLCYRG